MVPVECLRLCAAGADELIRHDVNRFNRECDELEPHLPSDTAEAGEIYAVELLFKSSKSTS